jgi:hypothetical protein
MNIGGGGGGRYFHAFLTSALDAGEFHVSTL